MKRYGVCLLWLLTLLTSCTTETIPDIPVTTEPETVPTETTVITQPKETISPTQFVLSFHQTGIVLAGGGFGADHVCLRF